MLNLNEDHTIRDLLIQLVDLAARISNLVNFSELFSSSLSENKGKLCQIAKASQTIHQTAYHKADELSGRGVGLSTD
jgi:hypothetical protein